MEVKFRKTKTEMKTKGVKTGNGSKYERQIITI